MITTTPNCGIDHECDRCGATLRLWGYSFGECYAAAKNVGWYIRELTAHRFPVLHVMCPNCCEKNNAILRKSRPALRPAFGATPPDANENPGSISTPVKPTEAGK